MKVIGVDEGLSSHLESMGNRFLIVDEDIAPTWIDFFNRAKDNYFSTDKRSIWFERNKIVVNCPLDDLQNQIDLIQMFCASADRELAEFLAQEEKRKQSESAAREEQEIKARNVFNGLKF